MKFGSGERQNSGSELSKGAVGVEQPEEEGMGVDFESYHSTRGGRLGGWEGKKMGWV